MSLGDLVQMQGYIPRKQAQILRQSGAELPSNIFADLKRFFNEVRDDNDASTVDQQSAYND
jgi:hypothetical protein